MCHNPHGKGENDISVPEPAWGRSILRASQNGSISVPELAVYYLS